MAVNLYSDGRSVQGSTLTARWGVPVTVTGTEGLTLLIVRVDGVEVGRSTTDTALCNLSAVAPGTRGFTARVTAAIGAGTHGPKLATVVSDPQPGPGNTGPGVPDSELEPYAGTSVIRSELVLEGALITRPIPVRAGGLLVVRSSAVRCGTVSGELVIDCRDGGRVVMEDCEVDGLGTARIGLGYSDVTIRRCNIHHVNDGLRMASRSVLEDSWVHDLSRISVRDQYGNWVEQHPDAVQITGGSDITVRHNTLSCIEDDGGVGNACVQINRVNPVTDVLIEDNWLDGGNYTVNIVNSVEGPVVLRNNRYGGTWRYGPILAPAHVQPDGDVVETTGTAPRIVRTR